MAMENKSNLLTAMEKIQIGEELAVAVTFVLDEDGEPSWVIGRVFGANGAEMFRAERDASGSYRGAVLAVVDELRRQWETNQSL
jgi:hypothetical protein